MRRRRRRLFGMFCVFLLLKIFQRSVCRRLHQTADADQNIDAFSDGVNADFAVHLFFVFSEFKHISEYCCFASICKGKNIERRFHRSRVCVVAVVDDRKMGRTDQVIASGNRNICFDSCADFPVCHTKSVSDCGSRKRVVHHVSARDVDMCRKRRIWCEKLCVRSV